MAKPQDAPQDEELTDEQEDWLIERKAEIYLCPVYQVGGDVIDFDKILLVIEYMKAVEEQNEKGQ